MKKLLLACAAFTLLSTAVYADAPAAPQGMTTDQLNRVLNSVIAQREQAMNSEAVCSGDETALQQQLAADQAKIDDLTKQLAAAAKPSTPAK